jgi:polyhydroxyalkanoate synthesis repressor PhaR
MALPAAGMEIAAGQAKTQAKTLAGAGPLCYAVAVRKIRQTAGAQVSMPNRMDPPADRPAKKEAVVIKKYANRRLYNTETSTYVTLDDLATMVRSDRDFVVYDAKTGDDLTHSVLTQIIVEQESRQGGQTLLPVPFLRQLIRFYDDQIGRMVPSYLQFSLETLAKEQDRFRTQFASVFGQTPFGAAAFEAMQQQTRKNLAIFEQAMSMWTAPFGGAIGPLAAAAGARKGEGAAANGPAPPGPAAPGGAPRAAAPAQAARDEFAELRAQLSAMQDRIEKLSKDRG